MTFQLPETWRNWVKENTQRGVSRREIYTILRKNGFGLGAIKHGMGETYPGPESLDDDGRDASGRTTRYDLVSECRLTTRDEPGLRRILTNKAQVYQWDNFLTPELCKVLVQLTDANLRDSTVTNPDEHYTFRTSKTCYLDHTNDPAVTLLNDKISKALGLSNAWSESTQAQRYTVGQEFKAHTDYFEPGSDEYRNFCATLGQRTWTFMIYLNEGCDGGSTRFRKLDKSFYPTTGHAVAWNSMSPEGDPNPYTIHHGMKVREGAKYVVTKWYRDMGDGPLVRKDVG